MSQIAIIIRSYFFIPGDLFPFQEHTQRQRHWRFPYTLAWQTLCNLIDVATINYIIVINWCYSVIRLFPVTFVSQRMSFLKHNKGSHHIVTRLQNKLFKRRRNNCRDTVSCSVLVEIMFLFVHPPYCQMYRIVLPSDTMLLTDCRFCTLLCPMWMYSSAFFKTDKPCTRQAHYRSLASQQGSCATWGWPRLLWQLTRNWGESKSNSGDPWQGSSGLWLGCYRDTVLVRTGTRLVVFNRFTSGPGCAKGE